MEILKPIVMKIIHYINCKIFTIKQRRKNRLSNINYGDESFCYLHRKRNKVFSYFKNESNQIIEI